MKEVEFFFLEKMKWRIKVAERGIQLTTLVFYLFFSQIYPVRTRELRATVLAKRLLFSLSFHYKYKSKSAA